MMEDKELWRGEYFGQVYRVVETYYGRSMSLEFQRRSSYPDQAEEWQLIYRV
jgi:hypothetical protein